MRVFWLVLLLSPTMARADDGMRCGGRLVSVGETAYQVVQKCGAPADVRQARHHRQAAEMWVYDWGQRDFIRVLTFVGGILTLVEVGDYGHQTPP